MVSRGSSNEFLFRKMVSFVCFLWFSIGGFLLYLIRIVSRYFSRFHGEDANKKYNSSCSTVQPEISKFEDSESDEPREKDIPEFCFKFQYQTLQERQRGNEGIEGSLATEGKYPTVSTSKYQFVSGKNFCGFMEEPEDVSFTVKELYGNSNYGSLSNQENIDEGYLTEENFLQLYSETETVQEELVGDDSTDSHYKTWETGETGKTEGEIVTGEFQFLDEFSLENLSLDQKAGFLSDSDIGKSYQTETILDFSEEKVEKVEMTAEIQSSQETRLQNSNMVSTETMDTSDQSSSANPIIDESEQPHLLNSRMVDNEILCESDIEEDDDEEEAKDKEKEAMDGSRKTEEPNRQTMQKSQMPGHEEGNELETLWEHQDLIEQLKMELKKVRAIGLPTILEESESPRVMEDLKPWKIDEKFLHEDRMDELHKFYKSYRERMRKFDILNYQKMYAIGFLQLKDPLQSISNRKFFNPAITTILSQNFWMGKYRKSKVDPTVKFIGELQSDLEMVYVGQMCLSWEILHWQYGKAQELQNFNPYGSIDRYNQVAGEFQQFQVLMQRFLENEAFQGPRVQNYVKNRCVLRNLIQVPMIKEDFLKEKKKARRGDDDAITIAMLTEIIERSMRIFWDFVRADDKDEASLILKGFWRTQVELQNPADLKLLTEIRTNIQKKDKKLKDILRSGNCIVKRFQKQKEDISDLILFFSEVDMKLISRVLNMPRITSEQLAWCNKKLNKINFVNRKIYREPSFLLFPC
ncbi:hypothetical protein NE237_020421 [Protea cynaroides]|uniref:Ribosomal protein L34Ae n=1 Tax=Protea cynaroides TaxID=273540 RepID=A0A9Q0K2A5_9MAGN|nr:hypothetical protein NE237_020421 [Protea cynaroides]